MNSYRIYYQNPSQHFISINYSFETLGLDEIALQLPSWRPGRYELANFAKNIRDFLVVDEKNQSVQFRKLTKDAWLLSTKKCKSIRVSYNYYAAELNAGSSFLDEHLLYVNPVNCCMFVPHLMEDEFTLKIECASSFELVCGLNKLESKNASKKKIHIFQGQNFQELADSPFIAAKKMQQQSYTVGKTKFTVAFQGECKPDWKKIIPDFQAFTAKQVKAFGDFPVKHYYFMIHVLPNNFYHGVEHLNCSVNAIGPAYELMDSRYVDLLGLCSHELYHAWNIKSIRPAEMYPYNFTSENYFRTGYVAEGVTTFMGDYFLYASKVFNDDLFLNEMNQQLQKHFDNFGRTRYSVADSSFDTWLDGYVPGVPERKVSIYTEGCLIAFMTDILIRKHSANKKNLHTVMRSLYIDFSKKGKGYSEEDYWDLVESYAGTSFKSFRKKYVDGTEDFSPQLKSCLDYIGCRLTSTQPINASELLYGIRINDTPNGSFIVSVHPDSENYSAPLALMDRLIAINEFVVNNDANKWLNYFQSAELLLTVQRGAELLHIKINKIKKPTFRIWKMEILANASREQKQNFENWKSNT